jgi:SAM-dependent methyltransferase
MLDRVSGVEHGWEKWKWDDTLFAGSAAFYTKGRMPYAEGLADAMEGALELDGHGRLLDVGCGPGVVTLRLAHLYGEVMGLDPDPDMIKEATRQGEELGVTNATWVCLRAEDLSGELGTFRTVTFAASFHWMDRPRVATLVKDLLEDGGAAVQVDAPSYRADALAEASRDDLPYPLPPDAAVAGLRTRYLGPDLRAGQGIRNSSPDGEDGVFQAAGFRQMRRMIVPDGRVLTRTIDDLVAQRFSSSSTAPHLFGDRLASFEADLRELLERASSSGLFSVRLPDNVLSIWEAHD